MYLKNSFRVLFSNLNLVFKAMLFRLVVVATGLILIYGISYLSISVVIRSDEMLEFLSDIKGLWFQFIDVKPEASFDIRESVKALLALVKANSGRFIGCAIGMFLIFFLMNFILGLCNFTIGVMLDKHMSSITKTKFFQTMLENLKKAAPFELLFAAMKLVVYAIAVTLFILFVTFTGLVLSFMSVLIGLWIIISVVAIFYTFTCRLRPRVIHGMKVKNAMKGMFPDRKNFATIFASYIFTIVFVASFNVLFFITTLGSGLMVSMPLSYLFAITLQLVIDYTIENKRYYIDYDNIVVPKDLRGEDEKLLGDVDI